MIIFRVSFCSRTSLFNFIQISCIKLGLTRILILCQQTFITIFIKNRDLPVVLCRECPVQVHHMIFQPYRNQCRDWYHYDIEYCFDWMVFLRNFWKYLPNIQNLSTGEDGVWSITSQDNPAPHWSVGDMSWHTACWSPHYSYGYVSYSLESESEK